MFSQGKKTLFPFFGPALFILNPIGVIMGGPHIVRAHFFLFRSALVLNSNFLLIAEDSFP
jgi:hypothetical protein